MDTVTQMALGAAVGEVTIGDKVGNRAIYWGAAVGLVPDFDIIVTPFVSEVQSLTMHRAFSHSILFVLICAPLLGILINRVQSSAGSSRREWSVFSFWVLLTHIALDCLTTYGTQIFQPFSNYKVSLSSIFVIDPLYTVPLIVGVIGAMRLTRGSGSRRKAIYLGVGASSLYLLLAAGMKLHARSVFTGALQEQRISYERLKTTPTPFNSILWTGMAASEDTVWVGLYSILDGNKTIAFRRIERSTDLLDGLRGEREVQRLIWFSERLYAVDKRGGNLLFHDLRFGRTDVWLTDTGEYIFTWKLIPSPQVPDQIQGVRHQPERGITGANLRAFGRRILGR